MATNSTADDLTAAGVPTVHYDDPPPLDPSNPPDADDPVGFPKPGYDPPPSLIDDPDPDQPAGVPKPGYDQPQPQEAEE